MVSLKHTENFQTRTCWRLHILNQTQWKLETKMETSIFLPWVPRSCGRYPPTVVTIERLHLLADLTNRSNGCKWCRQDSSQALIGPLISVITVVACNTLRAQFQTKQPSALTCDLNVRLRWQIFVAPVDCGVYEPLKARALVLNCCT